MQVELVLRCRKDALAETGPSSALKDVPDGVATAEIGIDALAIESSALPDVRPAVVYSVGPEDVPEDSIG